MSDAISALRLIAEHGKFISTASAHAYAHTGAAPFPIEVIALSDIEPFSHGPGVTGLERSRAFSILDALHCGTPLPPINVYRLPIFEEGYRFRLYHGYHRYHLCLALGFSHIPAAINPYQEEIAL